MKLRVFHAEHRCAPCRDMHARIDTAIENFAITSGLDASGIVEYVDIDEMPELAPYGMTLAPTIILSSDTGVYFRSDGRCETSRIEELFTFASTAANFDSTITALPEASEDLLNNAHTSDEFSAEAPSADVVFYRTYSRRNPDASRESYQQMVERVVAGIADLGQLGEDDEALVRSMAEQKHVLPSGRWLWTGGTEWIKQQENFSGAYNCTSTTVNSPEAFGLMMELAMMGSGTGAILEKDEVSKLPKIYRKLTLISMTAVGGKKRTGKPGTSVKFKGDLCTIQVGDSRQGWCDAYQALIDLAMSKGSDLDLHVDLSEVRPAGEKLKGFGGTSNPVKLEELFSKVCALLSPAKGRKLTPVECCLLIDEAAACIVAGNIRRSAGMRQFSADDEEAKTAKLGLYSQDEAGNWRVDTKRENLRMANHTRVFHRKPTLDEITEAVTLQVQSGEGAIQYAPEAIARSNDDLLPDRDTKNLFIEIYENEGRDAAREYLAKLSFRATGDELVPVVADCDPRELDHRMMRYGLNPCGEILGEDFHCNLAEVHLNTIDPNDHNQQADAFRAAGLEVAALLAHDFKNERYQYSRAVDPIVGVSFTGLFDFFVNAFGADWLSWMFADRPSDWPRDYAREEAQYLRFWREEVEATVRDFCEARCLKAPNRMTTVQPAGTKSLLTGASSGWHPPKSQWFIRRITFGAHDPVALAARDAGYSVIPAPSARDEQGNLLNDILDPRVSEWLVEIPTAVPWADLPGCDQFDLHQLSAAAQFGLWMNVQQAYTAHNTSATIELRADEIEKLSILIYQSIQNDEGYISAALLQRFDATSSTFPRLPFEPIDQEAYRRLMSEVKGRRSLRFRKALELHDDHRDLSPQESACSSEACIANAERAERDGKNQ